MNATADRSEARFQKRSVANRIGDWFLLTLRTGRAPALMIAVGCGIIIYGLLFTNNYAVQDISVTGADHGDPVEIAAVSETFGVSVFRVDPEEAARRIAALPYVQRSEVTMAWPARVEITITEKQPVLAWRSGATLYLVDRYGTIIGSAPSSDLPTVFLEADLASAEPEISAAQVAAVNAVHQSLGDQIVQLEWRKIEGLTIKLQGDRTVIVGDPELVPEKLAIFSAVTSRLDEAWELLDLREPDQPYVK